MLPSIDIIYISISVITFALYSIFIKKVKSDTPIIFLFWIHTVNYLGFLGVYLFRKFILSHDVFAIEELISQFTFTNSPLYILMGLTFLGTFLIYARLINQYPISQVLPFIQISLLFTMTSYLILGDPFSLPDVIGVFIVCFGAILSALKVLPGLNFFEHLKTIPKGLWIGALCESSLIGLRSFITFLLTQKTAIDEFVMGSLKHVFPFSFQDPFYFNVGARFFVMIMFLGYIYWNKINRSKIVPVLYNNFYSITIIGLFYLISSYTYQDAFRITQDKNVLAALTKLSIPIVLFLSVVFLEEELNAQKIIGSILIVGGGALVLLF